MALTHSNATVQTTASLIVELPVGVPHTAVQIFNGHSAAIFLGDANVTTGGATRGNSVAAGTSVQVWLRGGDKLYAVAAAATATGAVSVIYSGV